MYNIRVTEVRIRFFQTINFLQPLKNSEGCLKTLKIDNTSSSKMLCWVHVQIKEGYVSFLATILVWIRKQPQLVKQMHVFFLLSCSRYLFVHMVTKVLEDSENAFFKEHFFKDCWVFDLTWGKNCGLSNTKWKCNSLSVLNIARQVAVVLVAVVKINTVHLDLLHSQQHKQGKNYK